MSQRLDQWIVFARFVKTRTIAVEIIGGGKVRVNGDKVKKPSFAIKAGDVLTLNYASQVRLIRILDVADKRGSPEQAQQLYEALPD
ncbi:MAG: RNA-binding S4 domain-containing protein [Deltaproteobacteria bacterium]